MKYKENIGNCFDSDLKKYGASTKKVRPARLKAMQRKIKLILICSNGKG